MKCTGSTGVYGNTSFTCAVLFLPVIVCIPCCYTGERQPAEPPQVYFGPDTILFNTEPGYVLDMYGDSIEPYMYQGDTVDTGTPFVLQGKIIRADSLPPPQRVHAGKPRSLHVPRNIHPVNNRTSVSFLDTQRLGHFLPGPESSAFSLITTTGDTLPTGIPISITGIKVAAVQPLPVRASRPLMRDDALCHIQFLDTDQGLNNSNVTSILEDKSGNIWFGTYVGGLTRYDGSTLTHYTMPHGLVNDYVSAIIQDRDGVLWIGTHGRGICRFDGTHFTHYSLANGLSSNFINALCEAQNGDIWMATRSHGISRFTPSEQGQSGTIVHYGRREGIRDLNVRDITEDRKGQIWMATGSGAICFTPARSGQIGQITYFTKYHGLLCNGVSTVYEDRAGVLWFGTNDGVTRLDGNQLRQFTPTDGFPMDQIRSIIEDSRGNLWFGSYGGGVCYYDGSSFTVLSETEGLPGNLVTAMYEDTAGNIWIGTNGTGLGVYKPGSFMRYFHRDSLSIHPATAIHEDKNGDIWIGTRGIGILKYTPPDGRRNGTLVQYTTREGLHADYIWSICEDSDGSIWLGSWGNGVCKFDGSVFTNYNRRNGLSSNDVRSIVQDARGNMWFGTIDGGVTCFRAAGMDQEAEFIQYTLREGLVATSIRKLLLDSQGALWLGTIEKGTVKFELSESNHQVTATYLSTQEGLPNRYINDIIEDEPGLLWFAAGSGVTQFREPLNGASGEFVVFDSRTGLSNPYTRSVRKDHQGNVWAATANGLNVIRASDSRVFSFDRANGLRGTEFEFGSACIDRQNRLWWGSNKGIEVFNAGEFHMPATIPQPGLRRLEINGAFLDFRNIPDSLRKDISYSSVPAFENYPTSLALPHSKGHLTFYYSAIDWAAPLAIRYTYAMEGLNEAWGTPTAETKAEYRNLPPGMYTFRVKAMGASQQWSDPFEYTFTILPPWWQTWWAYLIYGILGISVAFAIYRFQLMRRLEVAEKQRLLELDKLKNELYINITHEFRTPLTLIHGPLSHALTTREALDEKDMKSMYQHSRRLQQLITQMLDLQKVEAGKLTVKYIYGDIVEFSKYLFNTFQSHAREKGITLVFSARPESILMDYDEEKFTQILTNLVSNAIRHTSANGTVSLSVQTSANHFQMDIRDTGTGIKADELPFIFDRYYQSSRAARGGTGIGLALAKSLTELLKGMITVESHENSGTIFRISLPVTHTARDAVVMNYRIPEILAEGPDDEVRFASDDESTSEKPLVLVVEDHQEVAQFISSCLRKEFSTLIAMNGDDGIEKAFQNIPDLVISDVMMPGKNGFELCTILKKDINTSHIPVILLTGRGDHGALMEGIEHGADAYVVKPFEPAELLLRVKKLLELRTSLRAYYARLTPEDETTAPDTTSPKEHAFLEKIRSFVEEHISDPQFNMHMLCQHMAMSHPQLHRKVTALTGQSTGKLVRSVRLAKAIDLLKGSDLTVSEIAYETGFSEPGYFTKVFAKEYRLTPTEYRAGITS